MNGASMNLLTKWEPFTRWNPGKKTEDLQTRSATTFGREPIKDGMLTVHLTKTEKAQPKAVGTKVP